MTTHVQQNHGRDGTPCRPPMDDVDSINAELQLAEDTATRAAVIVAGWCCLVHHNLLPQARPESARGRIHRCKTVQLSVVFSPEGPLVYPSSPAYARSSPRLAQLSPARANDTSRSRVEEVPGNRPWHLLAARFLRPSPAKRRKLRRKTRLHQDESNSCRPGFQRRRLAIRPRIRW